MNKPRSLRSIIWVFNHLLVDNAGAIYHFAMASNNGCANQVLENGYGFAIGGPGYSGDGAIIGLGASIAEHLAVEGCRLALLARCAGMLEAVANTIVARITSGPW